MSIMCLTGPCLGCHVARQPRQKSHGPGGQAGVTVCPKWSPQQHGVQIGKALLQGGQLRGDPILCVWASGDCVLTSVNPTTYRSAKIRWRTTTAVRGVDVRDRQRVTSVSVCVCVNVCIIHQTRLSLPSLFQSVQTMHWTLMCLLVLS